MAEISREDLYETVWSRPMMKVAAEHGVTGTGLKKICDRHDIPTPERGYGPSSNTANASARCPCRT